MQLYDLLPRTTCAASDVCSCFIDVELLFLFQHREHFPLDAQMGETQNVLLLKTKT